MNMYKTIRQTAAMGILPEHRLRLLGAQHACPGFYTGNRFMVNVNLLIELLDRQSTAVIKEGD